jgi:hypothetical protein
MDLLQEIRAYANQVCHEDHLREVLHDVGELYFVKEVVVVSYVECSK